MFVKVANLTKSFKKRKVVDGINFSVEEGEIFGLLGPNGAGKSTTISMICALIRPDDGDVYIDGNSVRKNPNKVKRLIGLVPQDIALYPTMTARENLFFWGRMYGITGGELKKRVDQVLDIVGLKDRADERIDKYSGGMKRRINIGAALIHTPRLLIMDEPTVGIDPQSRNHILETAKRLSQEGMTILYTSHYMEEVEFLCDRVAIMDEGKVIAEGTKDQLKEIVGHLDIVEVKINGDAGDVENRLMGIDGVEQVKVKDDTILISVKNGRGLLPSIVDILTSSGINMLSIGIKEPNLESVFLKLTGKALRD